MAPQPPPQASTSYRFTISDYIDTEGQDDTDTSPLNPYSQSRPFASPLSAPSSPPPLYSSPTTPTASSSSSRALAQPQPQRHGAAFLAPTPQRPTLGMPLPSPSLRLHQEHHSTAALSIDDHSPMTPPPLSATQRLEQGLRSPPIVPGNEYLGAGPRPMYSPDARSDDYGAHLTYPPRPDLAHARSYQGSAIGVGVVETTTKDERRMTASSVGSKRESGALALAAPQKKRGRTKFSVWLDRFIPHSTACRLLLLVVFLEMLIDVAIQGNILWRFNKEMAVGALDPDDYNARRLPVYLYIFISAHLLQLVLTIIAIRTRNTIQVIALAIFNALLLVYAGIEVVEIRQTLDNTTPAVETGSDGAHKLLTLPLNVLTGIVLGVIGLAELIILVLTYYIWREFGWRIYKFLGADLNIRRYYRQYQVYECVLCFSFFFFMSFSIQFLFLILNKKDPEYIVTWVMLPLSALWLTMGWVSARREWKWPMVVFLVGLLAGAAYFVFKLVRVWQNVKLYHELGYDKTFGTRAISELGARLLGGVGQGVQLGARWGVQGGSLQKRYTGYSLMDTVKSYYSVRKSLTVFSALSLFMILLCLVSGIVVFLNFGKGLKQHVDENKTDAGRILAMAPATFKPVQSHEDRAPHRLTID